MTDREIDRLAALPGVCSTTLAALALFDPSLVQLRLLRDNDGIRHFLAHRGVLVEDHARRIPVQWAWPRSGVGIAAVCWRQLLHEAMHTTLGREPTCLDLQYQTTATDGESWYRTVLDVTPFNPSPMTYEGAICARQTVAINSVAWVALIRPGMRKSGSDGPVPPWAVCRATGGEW